MLDATILTQLKSILFSYVDPKDFSVFIFGSRAMNKNRKYSDIDIGIEGKKALDLRTISRLQDAFDESDIPYIVDVVDFATVSDKFRMNAKKEQILLN